MAEDALSFWTDIQRYEDMLEQDPRSHCFAALSELYRKLGLVDDAVAVAEKGSSLHPEFSGGFLALGAAYLEKGLTLEARRALERACHLDPHNLRVLKLLGQLYYDAGETGLARQTLERILTQEPADLESDLLLRSLDVPHEEPLLEQISDDEEIEELTEEILELEALEEWEELEEPRNLDDSEPLQEPEPLRGSAAPAKDPLTTATLAELYVSQGFLDKALAIYQTLLLNEPDNLAYRRRCLELAVAKVPEPGHPQRDEVAPYQEQVVDVLAAWLEKIRRRRNGD